MTDIEIKLAKKNGVAGKVYSKLVQELINKKYSIYAIPDAKNLFFL